MSERRSRKKSRLTIEIVEDAGDWTDIEDAAVLIEAAAAEVATEPDLALKTASCSVVLSSDANVQALNGAYRGKDKPTNVLSFPAGPNAEPGYIGDIVLAIETLQREAASEDIALEHHLQHLVVHGLLHLVGFDHETDADAERMETLEIRILARLGVANPYTAPLERGKIT
ncbi:MAG: rRNA maturation RNase YbeY [Hyphomicrobium sp.]